MDQPNDQKESTQTEKKIAVDANRCIGCGLCVSSCGDVFELDENGKSKVKDANACEKTGCCQEAIDNCPAHAIAWEETEDKKI